MHNECKKKKEKCIYIIWSNITELSKRYVNITHKNIFCERFAWLGHDAVRFGVYVLTSLHFVYAGVDFSMRKFPPWFDGVAIQELKTTLKNLI